MLRPLRSPFPLPTSASSLLHTTKSDVVLRRPSNASLRPSLPLVLPAQVGQMAGRLAKGIVGASSILVPVAALTAKVAAVVRTAAYVITHTVRASDLPKAPLRLSPSTTVRLLLQGPSDLKNGATPRPEEDNRRPQFLGRSDADTGQDVAIRRASTLLAALANILVRLSPRPNTHLLERNRLITSTRRLPRLLPPLRPTTTSRLMRRIRTVYHTSRLVG